LEREADQVLSEPDNVARRARIAPVFRLAERYDSLGQTKKAISYYTRALEHEPWNLDAQVAMARLLYDAGQTNSSRQKAELVWDHAETDDLLIKAAKLLGKPFDRQLSGDTWPPGSTGMALVPIGKVDAWLLLELRAELPSFLGIPVIIQQRRFRDELAFLRRLGPQWDANELVARMGKAFAPQPGSGREYLGVTTMDLYANESRDVFGMAGMERNCGVFSHRRYSGSVSDEPPNRERLKQRALKQALSSTGLMFGLPRCTDPTCARAYANSLAEHDAKQVKLCRQCQQAFTKYFGN
jgi:predicted Zn-dependent protease